jgi:hypothetical protein
VTTPALNIPIKVVGLDQFKSNMTEMNVTAANAARAVTATTIKMSAGFLASQGAAGAATLAFGRMLGFLRPIALGVTAVVDTFEFLKKSVELAGQEIEAFGKIAADAASANVSTDFYQRFTKTAPNAVLSVDQVTDALKRFNQASTDRLGGSDLQQRITELVGAGNFAGNTGVDAFAGSNNTEQKLRAIVSLIDQAMQKGQQMAALDIAGKAFGEPVRAALQADNGYLDQMLQKADAMSKAEIVSQDDIGRVIQIRDKIDEAQRILADKWKPIQADMAELGLTARDNWASVVSVFAELVGLADKLYGLVKEIPDAFAAFGNASFWKDFTDFTGRLGLNETPDPAGFGPGVNVDATNRLRAALQNPANTRRAMQETTAVQTAVRGDTSKAPGKVTTDQDDKVDNAINSLRKHTEQTEADTKAIGLGEGALAKFRAEAQETAAVQANGGKETADQAAAFKQLQEQAGAAADALAKAKVNSQISFGRQTALLTPEDVQIANQLKGIYGDNIPAALNSSEAAAIRWNNQIKSVGDSIQNDLSEPLADFTLGTKSASDAFSAFATSFARDLIKMGEQALIIKPLLSGIGGLFGFGTASSAPATSPFPGFAQGTPSAPGGIALVGEEGPELVNLPRGAAVYPAHTTRALLQDVPAFADGGIVGSPGAAAPLIGHTSVIAPSINVSVQGSPGASEADHARTGQAIASQIEPAIRSIIGDEMRKQMRPGGTIHDAVRRR